MATKTAEFYAIVLHSGAGYTGKPEFKHGLEIRSVTDKEATKVNDAGGIVFRSYEAADRYCYRECYPEDYQGLIPKAPGRFNNLCKIDGLPIYIP